MATEFQKLNIRVCSIAPGVFPSEMTEKTESDERNKSSIKDSFDPSSLGVPRNREGTDEEIAASVLYLAGRGGQYSNGLILHVDGGTLLSNPSAA